MSNLSGDLMRLPFLVTRGFSLDLITALVLLTSLKIILFDSSNCRNIFSKQFEKVSQLHDKNTFFGCYCLHQERFPMYTAFILDVSRHFRSITQLDEKHYYDYRSKTVKMFQLRRRGPYTKFCFSKNNQIKIPINIYISRSNFITTVESEKSYDNARFHDTSLCASIIYARVNEQNRFTQADSYAVQESSIEGYIGYKNIAFSHMI